MSSDFSEAIPQRWLTVNNIRKVGNPSWGHYSINLLEFNNEYGQQMTFLKLHV